MIQRTSQDLPAGRIKLGWLGQIPSENRCFVSGVVSVTKLPCGVTYFSGTGPVLGPASLPALPSPCLVGHDGNEIPE